MSKLTRAFQPNRVIDSGTTGLIVLFWAGTALLLWSASPWKTLPTPREIWSAVGTLWWELGMGPEMFTTLKLITHAVSLGGVDTLIQHPAALTHRLVPAEAKPSDALLRLSLGLEDPEDLTADLANALANAHA